MRRLPAVLGVLTVLFTVGGSSLTLSRTEAASEVVLETRHTAGINPFMPAAGTDSDQTPPAEDAGDTVAGNAPGLYGGTRDAASCDTDSMIAFLRSHPDETSAWAEVQGIADDEVTGYIGALTPVALRFDTAVTNHGFRGGRANPFQAVLQSGTAVLVDELGVPRVKCFCGNPLLPPLPRTEQSHYLGVPWPEFAPQRVTAVRPAAAPVRGFQLVDMSTGSSFTRGPRSVDDDDDESTVERHDVTDLDPDPTVTPEVVGLTTSDFPGPTPGGPGGGLVGDPTTTDPVVPGWTVPPTDGADPVPGTGGPPSPGGAVEPGVRPGPPERDDPGPPEPPDQPDEVAPRADDTDSDGGGEDTGEADDEDDG